MSAKVNKANVQRMVEEVANGKNMDMVDELISPDYVLHGVGNEEVKGTEGIKRYFSNMHRAFPDMHLDIEEMVADEDEVCTRYTLSCTHRGEIAGIQPTGKHIKLPVINTARFRDGRQVEVWQSFNMYDMLQQIGAAPAIGQAVR